MTKSTTERLAEYMALRAINNNMITVTAGLSIGQIGKAIANNTGINSSSIEKILHAYDEINPEWLLTGKGEMLKNEKKYDLKGLVQGVNETQSRYGDETILEENIRLKRENELLYKYIANLEKDLMSLANENIIHDISNTTPPSNEEPV